MQYCKGVHNTKILKKMVTATRYSAEDVIKILAAMDEDGLLPEGFVDDPDSNDGGTNEADFVSEGGTDELVLNELIASAALPTIFENELEPALHDSMLLLDSDLLDTDEETDKTVSKKDSSDGTDDGMDMDVGNELISDEESSSESSDPNNTNPAPVVDDRSDEMSSGQSIRGRGGMVVEAGGVVVGAGGMAVEVGDVVVEVWGVVVEVGGMVVDVRGGEMMLYPHGNGLVIIMMILWFLLLPHSMNLWDLP